MDVQYNINTIQDYPDNGKHLECFINLPFQIQKGEDGYCYIDKRGIERSYNLFKTKDKIDDRWIVHLTEKTNQSLNDIFEIKCHKDLAVIIKYCVKIYVRALKMELERMKTEFSNYI